MFVVTILLTFGNILTISRRLHFSPTHVTPVYKPHFAYYPQYISYQCIEVMKPINININIINHRWKMCRACLVWLDFKTLISRAFKILIFRAVTISVASSLRCLCCYCYYHCCLCCSRFPSVLCFLGLLPVVCWPSSCLFACSLVPLFRSLFSLVFSPAFSCLGSFQNLILSISLAL